MAYGVRSTWTLPLAICCLFITLFFIAATIVLALIPVYLPRKDINLDTTTQQETLSTGYASDATGAGSDTLTQTNSLSTQLVNSAGLSTNDINLQSATFIPSTASSRKKRQTTNSDGTITCEKSTGLKGDIFMAQYQITYPKYCLSTNCRNQYKTKTINSLRKNYQSSTVTMSFSTGGTKNVQLIFCGIFNSSSTGCTPETKTYAYLIDLPGTLYQFNPTTFDVTQIGPLNCGTSSDVYSLALQRNGIIWISYADGTLFKYNIRSKVCSSTAFVANQTDISPFTMTFVKSSTDTSETLYVSKDVISNSSLAKIDINTLTLSVVGSYNELQTYADLAGINDGRLFSVFDVVPYTIAQIDKSNAQILSKYPINRNASNDRPKYGLTVYNTRFFFFEGNGSYADIVTFDLSTNTTTLQKTIPQSICGASSSSCLGTS